MDAYGPWLARLNHEQFGSVARAAAASLLAELARAGCTRGTVVDLGSGSGILARLVGETGFDVLGVERSEAMLALARSEAPRARFERGSAYTAALPPCVAVCAIGEVFNYAFEPAAGFAALERRLRELHAALEPGGILLFDLSGPGRVGPTPRERVYELGEWTLTLRMSEDLAARRLVREHKHRPRDGSDAHVERHELALHAPAEVLAALARAGFTVGPREDYGEAQPRPGWRAYCARAAPAMG